MGIREIKIPSAVIKFFKNNNLFVLDYPEVNKIIQNKSGIKKFFSNQAQIDDLKWKIEYEYNSFCEEERREYGDFQTNKSLAENTITKVLNESNDSQYEFLLEPTCGRGNFIIASLKKIKSLKKIVGIEIHEDYVWESKFRVFDFIITNEIIKKIEIEIIQENIFDFDLFTLAVQTKLLNTLIVGNPPWVTNSELSVLNSNNLPKKSNIKGFNGIDAITGKGNFDIAEFISLLLLKEFSDHKGTFAFLIKNSVIKNIVNEQQKNKYKIGDICRYNIDTKKEFNVSVNASLFFCNFCLNPSFTCKDYDFYNNSLKTEFGWCDKAFVFSIKKYISVNQFEGKSIFIWRQGVKHDCSKIMELERNGNIFRNGKGDEVEIEEHIVYPLLKSSDLKDDIVKSHRKYVLITQKTIGQETDSIKLESPKAYKYLSENIENFARRKSTIYRGKPKFSIFGIGDYSFAKYKIAISGLYKTTHFSLVTPIDDKVVMLDDTCYFIGFDNYIDAVIMHYILNHRFTQDYFKAIIFPDSKRAITKDILMRMSIERIYYEIDKSIEFDNSKLFTKYDWNLFAKHFDMNNQEGQLTLFA